MWTNPWEREKSAFKIFCKSSTSILNALADLGKEERPSAEVIDGCEKFLCQLVSTKKCHGETAGEVRWKSFKAQSWSRCMDKMPPTPGAWHQVILRAHSTASAWNQDIICNPIKLDPCDFGWYMSESKFMPKHSDEFSAPSAVVELAKCGCVKSNCSKKVLLNKTSCLVLSCANVKVEKIVRTMKYRMVSLKIQILILIVTLTTSSLDFKIVKHLIYKHNIKNDILKVISN